MSSPQRTSAPWNFSVCKGARNPTSLKRQSPASKLGQHLRPQEMHLQDLCNSHRLLKAIAEDAGRKNKQLSDSMEEAFAAVSLPWLYRRAVGFLNHLQVEDHTDYFQTTLKAGGIMDVVERYPWTGEDVVHKRRDKRPGHHTGKVARTDEGAEIQIAWDDPYGGNGRDTFIVSNNGSTLTQVSTMQFADATKDCTYRTVYQRVYSKDS